MNFVSQAKINHGTITLSSIHYSTMENSGTSTTLQSELDEIIQEIQDGETFTCCHKSTEGERCRNTLSETTSTNLAFLLEKITALLRISSDGIGTLLEEASYLIMCVEVHQSDATVKYVEWSRRIADPIIEIAQIEESVKVCSSIREQWST